MQEWAVDNSLPVAKAIHDWTGVFFRKNNGFFSTGNMFKIIR